MKIEVREQCYSHAVVYCNDSGSYIVNDFDTIDKANRFKDKFSRQVEKRIFEYDMNKLNDIYKDITIEVDHNFCKLNLFGFIDSRWLSKSYPLSLHVTTGWIAKKIELMFAYHSTWINITHIFKQLQLPGDIYFTSFGFSYDCFFKGDKKFKSDNEILSNRLKELGIEFTNEFSDAYWVFRYRISKKKENLDKINNLNINGGAK